ncbi:MAG TPA: subclass B3 metallo-beta-lactamase, partial [Gammaproteobacteria bacterium]|nr:subclass B3 metallo-beta-lactamase [Gammaproteobacteria bacterium]
LTPEEASWNQPVTPFRIIGDLYYVGASDITSYLIATPKGLILLDSGFAETVPQVEANIKTLGFKLSDVKFLLNSHAHNDHAGGLARLKRDTHATLEVSAADAALMARGGHADPNFGDRFLYEPVHADKLLKDRDQVELGGVVLTARVTPGHTPGCTTWTMRVEEGGKPYDVVFLCSVTAPGYQLANNSAYPDIVADFTRSFALLKSLPCDVFLGAHGRYYGLQDKIARLQKHESGNPFVDPAGYRAYLDQAEQAFQQELATQRQAATSQARP